MLTVGVLLALSLLVMVAGITATVGWAVRDRAARDEQAAREFASRQVEVSGHLERILDEVAQLAQAEKWSEALVSAGRAQPLLARAEAAANARERVREALTELEFVQQLDEILREGGRSGAILPSNTSLWPIRSTRRHFANSVSIWTRCLWRRRWIEFKSHRSILPPVITAIDDWAAVRNLSQGGSEARRLVAVIDVCRP